MKTEDLISVLAADTMPGPSVARQLVRAMPLALGVSLGAFALWWGPRPDIGAALASLALLKTLVPLALVLVALLLALALVHPGRAQRGHAAALGVLVGLVVLAFLAALLREGGAGLARVLSDPSLVTCLASVPVLGLPLLAAMMRGLSSGAALRPRLAGAAAGLVAGGGAAAIYSLHCDRDIALFVLPAYSAAIALVMLAGALLGPRLLRW